MTEDHERGSRRHGVLGVLTTLDHGLGAAERFLVAGGILAMAAIMVLNVVGRVFFGVGLPGATELTELLIVLVTFVGLSYGVRCARHISMSAIYDQLTGFWRKALLVTICLVTGVLMLYLAYEAAGYAADIYDRGRRTSALQMPLWIVYSLLPIGFTLAGVQYLLTAVRNLTTSGVYRSFTEEEGYAELPAEADVAAGSSGKTGARGDVSGGAKQQ